jgi:hypothetical protein
MSTESTFVVSTANEFIDAELLATKKLLTELLEAMLKRQKILEERHARSEARKLKRINRESRVQSLLIESKRMIHNHALSGKLEEIIRRLYVQSLESGSSCSFIMSMMFDNHTRYFRVTIVKYIHHPGALYRDIKCTEFSSLDPNVIDHKSKLTVACALPIDQFGFPLVHKDNTKKSEEAKAKYDELTNENMRDHFLIKHRRMNFYSLEKANIQRAMDFYFSTIKKEC